MKVVLLRKYRAVWALACFTSLLRGSIHLASAEMILIDDFNSGDVGWTRYDVNEGQSFGPGVFDLSSGAYRLTTSGEVPPPDYTRSALGALWDESADARFSNGFVRTKFRLDTEGSAAAILFRFSGDPATAFNGYGFLASTIGPPNGSTDSASFFVLKSVGVEQSFLGAIDGPGPGVGDEWWMEAGGVDDLLSMKVWRVGDPVPAAPQLTFHDSSVNSGMFGFHAQVVSSIQDPVRVDATFDDVYFTVGVSELAADFDGDGDVDGADFLAWQRGDSPGPLSATDLADWQATFGEANLLAMTHPVPEPATALLACAMMPVWLACRNRPSHNLKSLAWERGKTSLCPSVSPPYLTGALSCHAANSLFSPRVFSCHLSQIMQPLIRSARN